MGSGQQRSHIRSGSDQAAGEGAHQEEQPDWSLGTGHKEAAWLARVV